jgi:hypothetical protein
MTPRMHYTSAPSSGANLMTSWRARPRRTRQAERAREHARIGIWEYEGGSLFHPRRGYER